MYSLKKINPSLIPGLIFLTALGTVATSYYFIHKENIRSSDFNSNLDGISRLSQLNTKWVSSVEETRNFALKDFDKIALYTKKIRANLANLDNSGLLEKEKSGEETVEQYQIFKNSFEVKYEAIERYKSEQAILRNSANFLQASANDALANIENVIVKGKINHTAAILNTFLLLNNSELEEEANAELDYLQSYNIDNESTLGKEAIRVYISHVKIILEYNPRVNEMLESANDVDIETLTDNVSASYVSYHDISNDTVDHWRKVLLGGVGGLFIALISFLSRFRKNSKNAKFTQKELHAANTRIDTVSDDILNAERIAGRSHLALATLRQIQINTSPIESNINLLKNLTESNQPTISKEDLFTLISDLEFQKDELKLLNEAITSDETNTITSFDVNQLLKKAISTVKSETSLELDFKTQFGRLLTAKNNPIATFQIFIKLMRLSISAITDNDTELKIHLHTWGTDNYINLYMSVKGHDDLNKIYSGKGMAVVQELIDQNNISIKVTTLSNNNGTITLKIPKDPLNEAINETEEDLSDYFEEPVIVS